MSTFSKNSKKRKVTKIKKSRKPFLKVEFPDKDFIDSLIEENPDIPNLKKYL